MPEALEGGGSYGDGVPFGYMLDGYLGVHVTERLTLAVDFTFSSRDAEGTTEDGQSVTDTLSTGQLLATIRFQTDGPVWLKAGAGVAAPALLDEYGEGRDHLVGLGTLAGFGVRIFEGYRVDLSIQVLGGMAFYPSDSSNGGFATAGLGIHR
jgi:hypothetical protein